VKENESVELVTRAIAVRSDFECGCVAGVENVELKGVWMRKAACYDVVVVVIVARGYQSFKAEVNASYMNTPD
jgi:hypothetical protein